ncbi:MAG: hypothetical protein WC508_00240 [Patescibacteria group bacterium]
MDYLETKINQLVVQRPGQPKTYVRTFATKPTKDLAGKLGKVFGLIEIQADDEKNSDLIDLIVDEIKNNYYYQKKSTLEEKPLLLSEKFEAALKKTNLSIASFLESEQISLNLEKINIMVAVICNQDLHFAVIGNIGAILFYNTNLSSYRIINILESTQAPLSLPDPFRLFSQIISGKIKSRDILFVSTANILDYFSLERIKNIIATNLPSEGLLELKKLLATTGSKENFGIMTAELEKITALEKKPVSPQEFDYRQAASQDSIKELINTERETEKFLTPSIMPEVKKYTIALKNQLQNYLGQAKKKTNRLYEKQKKTIIPKFNFQPRFNLNKITPKIKITNPLANLHFDTKKITQPILTVSKTIGSKITNQPFWAKAVTLINKALANPIGKYKQLPKSSQVLLITTIILAVLFSLSLFWLGIKNWQDQKKDAFNLVFAQAENKKNEAEASLIYRDENQARQFLVDSKNMIANLKPITKFQKQQIILLQQGIEEQLQKLRHLIEITEPIQIVNFGNLDSQAKIANVILLSGRNVYTQNQNNQSIYKANLDTRVLTAALSPDSNTASLIFGTAVSDKELIFLNASNTPFLLTPGTDSFPKLNINFNKNINIADFTSFKGQLYTLDSKNSQIYRYSKVNNDYSKVNGWLKDNIVLNDAKAFTVDGSIYIVKTDGSIIKLQNGKPVDFKTNVVDPKIQNPTKIKTDEFSKYLYVLDPPTKRLIVFDKNGNLINQYHSEAFTDLKDFIVVEREKKMYLLNGTSILGVPAQHLK